MKYVRKLILCLLPLAFAALLLWGCAGADKGSKKVGGYFDANTVFSLKKEEKGYTLTLFNQNFSL